MITCTPLSTQRRHLLDVARALREAPECERGCGFTMRIFGHECGSPACALGHYAVREDLQDIFELDKVDPQYGLRYRHNQTNVNYYDGRFVRHFGIDYVEACGLFGARGCDHAKTPEKAAAYIERFVANKWPQWSVK